jgi:hypothetical protein
VTRRQATFRGLAIFAAVWQGLWLVGDAAVRGMVVASPGEPAAVLLIAAMVAWLALWPCLVGPLKSDRRLRIVQISSMVFVVGAGLLLVARDSAAGADGWLVGASVVNLGAGLAGLYLTRTSGVIAVLAIVTAEIVLLAVVYAGGGIPWPLEVDLVYPFYAMALGLACVASRHALMKSASRQDAGELLLRRQQQVRASNESTDASVTRAETRLHETVLNTLTAIARGGLADDAPTRHRLAERARESADVLGAIARGSDVATTLNGDLRVDLTSVLIDVEESGMAVRLDGILDAGKLEDQVDDAIFVVVVSAVRESLFNVLRHAQATSVAVVGDVRRTPEGSWWRIRIHDNGQGFDTKAQGFGLRNVVVEAITECGGRVSIKSGHKSGLRVGWGTTVGIEVPLVENASVEGMSDTGPLAAITLPVVTSFSAFTAYTIGATWQYATNALPNAGAAAIFASMAALLVATALRHRGSLMPWWAVVAVLVGVPIMTHVEVLVASAANPTGDWTSEAGSALLFVIVASGPLWAAPAAAVSWFVAQEMQWIELTQPGMFVIIVAALLGWQLRRAQARARSLVIETERERAALAVSRSRLSQVRSRYYGVDTPGLIEMLEDIAAERVDPGDVEVREACAREERLIRSVLSLHPDEIVVHRDLVTLATVARGADVDLTIAVVDDLHAVMPLSTIDDAAALLAMARPGSKARASITRDRRSCTFRLVVEVDEVQAQVLPPAAEILDAKAGIVAIEEVCAPAFVDGPDAQRSAHV